VPLSRFYPGRDELANLLLVAATETVTDDDIDRFTHALGEVLR
jgi:glycine dehydrogenase subunit 1